MRARPTRAPSIATSSCRRAPRAASRPLPRSRPSRPRTPVTAPPTTAEPARSWRQRFADEAIDDFVRRLAKDDRVAEALPAHRLERLFALHAPDQIVRIGVRALQRLKRD